jgi:AcrR family transcriptional regulator
MAKLLKGELTRKSILDMARSILNEKGINLTLDNLASEMEMPKGRITNHFSTKDKLFLAILADYEEQLDLLLGGLREFYASRSFSSVMHIISEVMDLQFEYRCSIIYLNVLSPGQSELREHIRKNFSRNIEGIRNRISGMVKSKLIREEILEEKNFESFMFIYVNQLTQWVVYYDMYDQEKGYKNVKPVYIRGILNHVYCPFVTNKGKKELEQLEIFNQ